MNWLALIAENQLEEIKHSSSDPLLKGVLIFKHSTRCATSSMALNRLQRSWDFLDNSLPAYFLDLLKYPKLSSEIAKIYNIRHESPQVLFIKNGKCVYTASHSGINFNDIKDFSL